MGGLYQVGAARDADRERAWRVDPFAGRICPMRRPLVEAYRVDGYEIRILGGRRDGWRDAYLAFLRLPWWGAMVAIAAVYLSLNALFAVVYLAVGGVSGAARGSFLDHFFFSIQTMGTIGYGTMVPTTRAANTLVVLESVVGLVVIAVAAGLVFARFSQTRARVAFSSRIAVSPMDGVPHLMIRVGNERRRNQVVDATFRLSVMRTTRTAEGSTIYRTVDVPLVRERAPALQRSWLVLHRIDAASPLAGETPDSLARADAELTLSVSGIDDTSLQFIHARHTWTAPAVVFGARLADVISETPEGGMLIDLQRFHDLEPTTATPEFPYRASLEPAGGDLSALADQGAERST
jgi:inward rectifier potassium channel